MFNFISRELGKIVSWLAQATMPLGRFGARVAYWMFGYAMRLAPNLDEPRGWRYLLEATFARREGDAELALELLRRASRALPDDDIVTANLGIQLAMSGHYDEAITVLNRAMRGTRGVESEPQAWMALAWSYLQTGRTPQAIQACEDAQELGIKSPEVRILHLVAQGVSGGAVDGDKLGPLIRQRARMLPMLLELAEGLANKSEHDVAMQIVLSLPEALQERAYLIIARSALNSGELDTAMWALKRQELSQPDTATAPILRSEVCLRDRDYEAARTHAEKALSRAPEDVEAIEQMVRVCVITGDQKAALQHAQRVSAGKSSDALAASLVALEALGRGDLEGAQEPFLRQKSGDDLACCYGHAAQAEIAVRMGEFDRATEIAQQAIYHIEELPDWAADRSVSDHVSRLVDETLERVIEPAAETIAQRAGALRRRLAEARRSRPSQDEVEEPSDT